MHNMPNLEPTQSCAYIHTHTHIHTHTSRAYAHYPHTKTHQGAIYTTFTTHWSPEGALKSSSLLTLKRQETIRVPLAPLESAMFTVSPVIYVGKDGRMVAFAAVGLQDMFNCGGAVRSVSVGVGDEDGCAVAEVRADSLICMYE